MVKKLTEQYVLSVGDTQTIGIDCRAKLTDGELLTGTPTIEEQTTSDLTIAGKAVNSAAVTIKGNEVGIGQAVVCRVSGGTAANSPYSIHVTVNTDDSNVIKREIQLWFE